jgi:hypothetical protein
MMNHEGRRGNNERVVEEKLANDLAADVADGVVELCTYSRG